MASFFFFESYVIEKWQEKLNTGQKNLVGGFLKSSLYWNLHHTLTSPMNQHRTRPVVLRIPTISYYCYCNNNLWSNKKTGLFSKSLKTYQSFGYVEACSNLKHYPLLSKISEMLYPTILKTALNIFTQKDSRQVCALSLIAIGLSNFPFAAFTISFYEFVLYSLSSISCILIN